MKLRVGNIFRSTDQVVLITASSEINGGRLEFGTDLLKRLLEISPTADAYFAKCVQAKCAGQPAYPYEYNMLVDNRGAAFKFFGLFQTKYYFNDLANIDLIKRSCTTLTNWVKTERIPVSLNFPGIGGGGLTMDQIVPIIAELPDNVTIWLPRV